MLEFRIILHADDFREPEIGDLRDTVFEENIRRLQISMRHVLLEEYLVSFCDLINDVYGLAFRKTSLIRLKHSLQISTVAEFQDHVNAIRRPESK